MKRILIVLIVACMIFGVAACGKSAQEKAAEEMVKDIAEEIGDASGFDVDLNNEGEITISDGEDQLVVEGSESGMPWPVDKVPGNVPELKGAKIVSVASTDEGILIGFEECNEDEVNAYKKQIQSAGWNVLMDMSEADGGMITAASDAGESLMFVWDTVEQGGAITYGAGQ